MIANQKFQLRIVRPREGLYYGLVSSKKVLKIKIQSFSSNKQVDYDKFMPVLGKGKIVILLDGSPAAATTRTKTIKATYTAETDLSQLPDGIHTLQAVIQETDKSSIASAIGDSDIVSFIIDRNLPSITSILPSNGIKLEDRAFSRVLVEASGGHTGLYLKRCTVAIDNKVYKNPVEHKSGLVFSVPVAPKRGIHKLKLTIVDKAGNKSSRTSRFEIIEAAAQAEEQDWRERKGVVEEKLVSDIRFRRLLFTDARAAFAENGIPFTRAASSVLPPLLPAEHADFFASVDSDMASQKWDAMIQRAFQESPGRNDARIAQIREDLGPTGATTEDGGLTQSARDLVTEILQDPAGWFAGLGVTPSEEEEPFVFPSFSAVDASAFADWFSMTLAGKPTEPSEARQSNLQDISNRVSDDPDLLFRWLTKPAETYMEFYPDATPRDMAFLPDPLSDEEARRIIDSRSPAPTSPPPQTTPHNSSDLVVGFSIPILNEMLGLYFTTLQQPRVFPKSFNSEIRTELPSPYASIRCEIRLEQPDNLTVHDATAKLVSLTASASASVRSEDGTTYSYLVSLTPVYSILLKEEKVFLKFDRIGVTVADQGTGISDPTAAAVIKGVVESQVRSQYPDGEIYLVDQRPMNINIPFADVAVDIHRIWVHDDTDPGGSGELYFGIGIDGQEYLFGQFDADSGSTIEISRRFMLKKGGDSFPVQIQGIDMDMGVWPDTDDPLGSSMRYHAVTGPGTYTLRGVTPITSFQLVWDVVEFVLKVICWVIEALVSIFNWLFSWTGWRLEVRCSSWVEGIMGWIRKGITTELHTYTLEYSIVPLEPATITISIDKYAIAKNGLYLAFDFSIPGVGDVLAKRTDALGFVGSSDLGIALSENLINKIISAWWRYSPVPKRITSAYGTRIFYAHVDLDQPRIDLIPEFVAPFPIGTLRPRVAFHLATAGVVGSNIGPVHLTLGLPNGIEASILPSLAGRNLELLLNGIYFVGDNVATFLANLAASYAYNFEADKDKKSLVMDLASSLRVDVQGAGYELNPTAPVRINDAELIMTFSTEIAPAIKVTPNVLDFYREYEQTFKIENVGNETLTISEFDFKQSIFHLFKPLKLPLDILPGDDEDITVQVEAGWTGRHDRKLEIHNNAPASANGITEVRLVAHEFPILEVVHLYPGIWDGPAYWGTATWLGFDQNNGSKEIFIRNKGHADLLVTKISIRNRFFSSAAVPFDDREKFTEFTLPPYDPNDKNTERSVVITIDTNKLQSSSFGSGTVEDGSLEILCTDSEYRVTPFVISLHAQYLAANGGGQSGGSSGYQ